ncbi:MAG: hypothetical protein HC824_22410 [Synechococcales cyanobacterium RM1_1_8]|nr:hypothetical protein [Synechococcales cyanobacterium RM1_1_8]
MNRNLALLLIFFLALPLTACGSSAPSTPLIEPETAPLSEPAEEGEDSSGGS